MEATATLQTAAFASKNIFSLTWEINITSCLVAIFLSIDFYHSCIIPTFHLMFSPLLKR
jgi:hypothetical protein